MNPAENEPPIYLDHAATTPILPEVAEAVHEAMLVAGGNASSQHALGRRSRRMLEDAREQVAELLGARPGDRLILTSGGTEANNHALRGAFAAGDTGDRRGRLILSPIEHPSVMAVAKRLEAGGVDVKRLPVGSDGVCRLDTLPRLLTPETRVVSLMLANSETGVLQPIEELVAATETDAAANGPNIAVHTDATQALGRCPVSFGQLRVAMLSFAAHKFHGPTGVGGLLVRGDCHPAPLLAGQADEERPGTPPAPLVVGMARALEIATKNLDRQASHMAAVRDRFEQAVIDGVPGVVVIGRGAARLPHTTNLAFIGHDRQALMMALDRAGVACSTGSACASGSSEPSPVLTAMTLPDDQVRGALRFSVGIGTTPADADTAAHRVTQICGRLKGAAEA